LQIFGEGTRRSTRLWKASTCRLPTPPVSLAPQEESFVRFPTSPQAPVLGPSTEGVYVVLQTPREDIGKYNGDYIDSQENFWYASYSSCEKFEEDDFMEGDYANDEVRSLEDMYGGPRNACTMFIHFQEGMRRGKGGEKGREGSVIFPWKRPRAHLFCKISLFG
jgi:hypothetical protein